MGEYRHVSEWTQGPWELGEFSEFGGYDMMTAGVRAGPANLDGAYPYGQKTNGTPMEPEAKSRMLADARLIAAAPELADALDNVLMALDLPGPSHCELDNAVRQARAALAKVRGTP